MLGHVRALALRDLHARRRSGVTRRRRRQAEAEAAAGGSADAADFEVGPVGQRGELCIRGPQVMVGYRDDPEKTAECLGAREEGQASGWLRTGDVAIADDEGYLWIV